MKKLLLTSLVALGLSVSANAADKSKTIIVGATPIPHAEILEVVKPILAKDGYTLEIKEFNDYTTPNLATEDGDLDANFFQHIPYLEEFNKNKGTHLVKTVGVHLEPMGVYSKKIKDIKELKDELIFDMVLSALCNVFLKSFWISFVAFVSSTPPCSISSIFSLKLLSKLSVV